MCLAIPGKVVEAFDQSGMRMAKVQFGGIVREACLGYVPETPVGDYVLVHVGFAISSVDEAEAHRTYQLLKELDQLTELNASAGKFSKASKSLTTAQHLEPYAARSVRWERPWFRLKARVLLITRMAGI
jgi:hydrogenase expression/formation protein HypC